MRLRRSIKSCSFVLLTCASKLDGNANALQSSSVAERVGSYEVVSTVSLIGKRDSFVPADVL